MYEGNIMTQLFIICRYDTTTVHNVTTVALLHVRKKYLGSMVVQFAYESRKLRRRTKYYVYGTTFSTLCAMLVQ